ncbi:MAG: DegV family protein [Dehalococcoidaceae bacterium]|nr:DegV family protein [Dehalococcoidaceae bacterium]
MSVKILTDSVADLPADIVKELDIAVIPIILRWGEEIFHDGVDITAEQFYERLKRSKIPPTTSLPSPGMFVEAYDKMADSADAIVAITVSSRMSGTYEVAVSSSRLMQKKCRVEVIDSETATMCQGFLVIKAARAAKEGKSLEEIIDVIRVNMPRVDFLCTFDTLEYLKRGGRIGKAQAFLGSLLKINPLITLREGIVEPAGRTHSRSRAIDRLVDFILSYKHIEELAILSATTPHESEMIAKRTSHVFPRERIFFSRPTPVIGTHTGPGFILAGVLGDRD